MKRVDCVRDQIKQRIQSLPKKSKYLTKDEIRQRIELLATLSPPNALRG
jgi:hypothetical protein